MGSPLARLGLGRLASGSAFAAAVNRSFTPSVSSKVAQVQPIAVKISIKMPLQAAYGKAFSTFSSAMSAASAPQCLAFAPGRIWSLVGGSQTGKAVGRRMNATAADAAVLTQSSALGAASARTCVSPLVAGVPEAGRKQVAAWLGIASGWVFALVVLGGVTRLTRSGLSMTEWKFTGEKPPMNDMDWEVEFEKYRASPEFQQVHSKMTLEEFKFIYWMEYGHRMWARALGLLFAVPAGYFAARGYINSALSKRLGLLFLMGGTQGLVGWWMVRSGLKDPKETDNPHSVPRVSPYRLAGHLASAFAIYTLLVWTALNMAFPKPILTSMVGQQQVTAAAKKIRGMVHPLAALIGVTALSGAFVAGNDAGRAYNTFPSMNGQWIPDEYFEAPHGWLRNCFENTAAVQLHHRCLALSTATGVLSLWAYASRLPLPPATAASVNLLLAGTALQVTLGVSTLLTYVPVGLGSAHQAGALGLFTVVLCLMHTLRSPLARSPVATRSLAFPLAIAAVVGVGVAVTQQQ